MKAKYQPVPDVDAPIRTTLLELVHKLSQRDLTPDEVVRVVHSALDRGEVELTGNFRDGLFQARTPSASRESSESADPDWSSRMVAVQRGDAEAYECLLRDLLPEVARIVRRILFDKSAVDDVVQNALIALHRARHTYRPDRPFEPWLRAIVRHTAIDHLRQIRRRKEREQKVEFIDRIEDPSSAGEIEQNEHREELNQLLAELPPPQRQALEMTRIEGLSSEEAANRVGISAVALRLRAHRGMCRLREQVKQNEGR